MFSLQTIFGKGDRFYGLLEASAATVRQSAVALRTLLSQKGGTASLEEFRVARQTQKDLTARISQELVNTFVTALEREDVEALAGVLYKIPKVIEKFAERYTMVADSVGDIDFLSRAGMLDKASEVIEQMVGELRRGMKLEHMKTLNDRLQAIESEADRLILDLYRDMFANEKDPIRFLLRKDLFEILEKAIDRCRDAGNVAYAIVLKNS